MTPIVTVARPSLSDEERDARMRAIISAAVKLVAENQKQEEIKHGYQRQDRSA